jgi:hypothetical protein
MAAATYFASSYLRREARALLATGGAGISAPTPPTPSVPQLIAPRVKTKLTAYYRKPWLQRQKADSRRLRNDDFSGHPEIHPREEDCNRA